MREARPGSEAQRPNRGATTGRRNVPGDGLERAPAGDVGDRRDQPARIRMPGAYEQPLGRSDFGKPPGVHHEDPVREAGDGRQIVADVHGPDLVNLAKLTDRLEDVRLGRDVETRRRLVQDDRLGAEEKRHRDADALLLPSGELVRVAAEEFRVGGEPYLLEHLPDTRADVSRPDLRPVGGEYLGELVAIGSAGLSAAAGSCGT